VTAARSAEPFTVDKIGPEASTNRGPRNATAERSASLVNRRAAGI
jgi:hypothetical protein